MIERSRQGLHPFRIQKVGSDSIQIVNNSALFYSFDIYDCITSEIFLTQEMWDKEDESRADAVELYGTSENAPQEWYQNSAGDWIQRHAPLKAFRIRGLGKSFKPRRGDKIYLQLDLDSSLDVKRAYIIYGKVGQEAKDTKIMQRRTPGIPTEMPTNFFKGMSESDEDWPDFPSLVQLRPKNSLNPKQSKAYLLIGYVTTEYNDPEYSIPIRYIDDKTKKEVQVYVVQCVQTNVIMTHYCQNGAAITYPMPFYSQMNRFNLGFLASQDV